MKRSLTLFLGMALTSAVAFSQTDILIDNFEGSAKTWQEGVYTGTEMTFGLTPSTHAEVVDNPWAAGANESAKSGKFTNYNVLNVAFSINLGQEIYFSQHPKITFSALTETQNDNNKITVVLYNSTDGFNKSVLKKTFDLKTTDWESFEIDFSAYPSKPSYYNTIGFMFNPDWETNETVFFVDDVKVVATPQGTSLSEVALFENFGTTGWIETDAPVSGFDTNGSGLISKNEATIICREDNVLKPYPVDETNNIIQEQFVQELNAAGAETNVKIFTPWGVNAAQQPYKNAGGISCGVYPNSSLYFNGINISKVDNATLSFAFMNHTWNVDGGNWDAQLRPTVYASVDGGAWSQLTTNSTFPDGLNKATYVIKAKDGVTDSTVYWYQVNQNFLIEYAIPEGNTIDIAISNRSNGITFYSADGVTEEPHGEIGWARFLIDDVSIKGNLATGIKKVRNSGLINVYKSQNTVTILSSQDVAEAVLYDLSGKQVMTVVNTKSFDVSKLNKGIYIIKVQTADGKVSSAKIVK
jgi:hypothetical protein